MTEQEEEATPLRAIFRSRRLDYASLTGPLKAVLWISYAVILLTAVLIALHEFIGGPEVGNSAGVVFPLYLLLLAAALGFLSFTIFITGAFASRGRFRIGLLAGLTLFYGLFFVGLPWLRGEDWQTILVGAGLLALPMGSLLVVMLNAHRFRLMQVAAAVAGCLVLAGLAAALLGALLIPRVIADILFFTFAAPVLFAAPMFVVASADFSEWGNVLSHRLRVLLVERLPLVVLAVACLVLLAANAAPFVMVAVESGAGMPEVMETVAEALFVFAVGAILIVLLRRRDSWGRVVRFPPIMAVAVGFLVIHYVFDLGYTEPKPPPAYSFAGEGLLTGTEFSVMTPDESWSGEDLSDAPLLAVRFWPERGKLPFVFVESGLRAWEDQPPLPVIDSVNQLLPGGLDRLSYRPMPPLGPPDRYGWQRFEGTIGLIGKPDHMAFIGWRMTVPNTAHWRFNRDWYIIGVARIDALPAHEADFARFKDTFTFARLTQPAQTGRWMALGIFAVVLLGALAMVARRQVTADASAVWTFVALAAGLSLARSCDISPGHTLINDMTVDRWMMVIERFGFVLASVAAGAWILIRRRAPSRRVLAELVTANLALLALTGVFYGFRELSHLSADNVIKALVALATLTWEVMVAGETLTNRDTPAYPRRARLLMHLGYVQFVALAVFLFFPFRIHGQNALGFDAEMWVSTGVVMVGLPLLLTLWVSRVADLLACEGSYGHEIGNLETNQLSD